MSEDPFKDLGFSIAKANEVQKTVSLGWQYTDATYILTEEDVERIEKYSHDSE